MVYSGAASWGRQINANVPERSYWVFLGPRVTVLRVIILFIKKHIISLRVLGKERETKRVC